MGYTRFSGIRGDSKAAGGAGFNTPMHYLSDPRYIGHSFNFFNETDFSVGAAAQWTARAIATGAVGTALIDSNYFSAAANRYHDLQPAWFVDPDTSHTSGRGSDLCYHTGSAYSAPFQFYNAGAVVGGAFTRTASSENFMELTVHKGTIFGATWSQSSYLFGMATTTPATTLLNTGGTIQETANMIAFYKAAASNNLSMIVAGASGGVTTLSTTIDLSAVPFIVTGGAGTRAITLGIRVVGNNKAEFYFNRRLAARATLSVGWDITASGTISLSGVNANTSATNNIIVVKSLCFSSLRNEQTLSYPLSDQKD